jgi:hypothetical protein
VVDVEDLATEENEHRTGRSRVKPLDIIERRGDLVRFYNIAKKAWE